MKTPMFGTMTRKKQTENINKAYKLLKEIDKKTFYYGSNLKEVLKSIESNLL